MSDGIRLAKVGRINLYERMSSGREHLHDMLRRLIREGWLRRADVNVLGMAFVSPLVMWRQLHAIDADLPMIREPHAFARQHVEQFLRGAGGAGRPLRPVAFTGSPARARRAAPRDHRLAVPSVRRPVRFVIVFVVAACRRGLQRRCHRRSGRRPRRRRHRRHHRRGRGGPVTRFIRVSGTLTAEDEAEVAAEIAGRVVATPVERGSRVTANGDLVRIAAAEVEAQAREAQANAAQIEARLGIAGGAAFDVERVPEVANAQAARRLARTDFERAETLQQSKLHLAGGVRPEQRADGGGRAAVRRREQRRRAAVSSR